LRSGHVTIASVGRAVSIMAFWPLSQMVAAVVGIGHSPMLVAGLGFGRKVTDRRTHSAPFLICRDGRSAGVSIERVSAASRSSDQVARQQPRPQLWYLIENCVLKAVNGVPWRLAACSCAAWLLCPGGAVGSSLPVVSGCLVAHGRDCSFQCAAAYFVCALQAKPAVP
jgi:hypothetical protein